MKINKYLYNVWKLYVNYGTGWELETYETNRKEYKENKKAYAENCKYPHYWKFVNRMINPEWN